MKRKLIKQGTGGITISLPIEWVRKHNLEAGDEIVLEEQDGQLMVSGQHLGHKQATIRLDEYHPSLLRTVLASYYRKGYIVLHIESNSPLPIAELESLLESLMGYEIQYTDKCHCTVQDTLGAVHDPPEAAMNKLFQSTLLLASLVREKQWKEAQAMRRSILKLRDYTQRSIVLEQKENCFELYALALFIEKAAGEYQRMTQEKKMPADARIYESLLKEAHSCFLGRDSAHAQRFYLKAHKQARAKQAVSSAKLGEFLFGIASKLQSIAH